MQQMNISSWSDYKTLISNKKLSMQYVEGESDYFIYAPEDHTFMWMVVIEKSGADGLDFDSNFKTSANAALEIKAGLGRPERTCISPQPNNTNEKWKGFELTCGVNDSSVSTDISFGTKIYLRGGRVKSADVVPGDKFKVEVQMQVSGIWTTVMTPMEDISIFPNIPEETKGDDCMEFPTTLRLKFTFTPSETGKEKKIYLTLYYYV